MATASISYCDVDLLVTYEFVKGEPPVLWGDYPHPGCPDCAEISSVLIGGVEVYEMLSNDQLDRIEEKVRDEMDGDDDYGRDPDEYHDDERRREPFGVGQ